MKPISLKVVSVEGIEATITCDGSQDGYEAYFSLVSIKGFFDNKKIYGIDPVQSFSLGWALIEKLTTDRRIGEVGNPMVSATTWQIENT